MKTCQLTERFAEPAPLFSIEFFPPKSDQAAQELLNTAENLSVYQPDFVSITYGAGGSTRNRTLSYAKRLNRDFNFKVMPHLTCVGHSRDELIEIIREFREAGFMQIMALRGDPPKGETDFTPHPNGLHHANELVELIKREFPECAQGVAGYPEKHPEAPDGDTDLLNLKRKVDAGATFITTQLFFDNRLYFQFVEKCRSLDIQVPVLPGLMSVTSREQAKRFCAMCGATIPEELDQQLLAAGTNKEAIEAIGIEWTYQQAKDLLENGAPGLHLYIMNRAAPAMKLMDRLKGEGVYA
ncbi:MAG: methylenetetrahydrofolate reductase [NAD(P)H] [Verrucomicrobiota bacterium]